MDSSLCPAGAGTPVQTTSLRGSLRFLPLSQLGTPSVFLQRPETGRRDGGKRPAGAGPGWERGSEGGDVVFFLVCVLY